MPKKCRRYTATLASYLTLGGTTTQTISGLSDIGAEEDSLINNNGVCLSTGGSIEGFWKTLTQFDGKCFSCEQSGTLAALLTTCLVTFA